MAFDDYKNNLTQEIDKLREFAQFAKEGLSSNEEIQAKAKQIANRVEHIDEMISEYQNILGREDNAELNPNAMELLEQYGAPDDIQNNISFLSGQKETLTHLLDILNEQIVEKRNFDKNLCFSNIRYLLKQNSEVKIGQIEKEAGISVGYMSRLEKDGNTSEPSMEFVVTAAKLLKVSLDSLISVDLAGLTPTEHYITNFFDKLKKNTLADMLDWNRETAYNLNRIETDMNGNIYHPLFSEETFLEETETGYPQEVSRIVFNSKTFGPATCISGDCFNLRLKNGAILYLMDISKSVHKNTDAFAYAKEAWMYVPYKGKSFLVASQDETPVAQLLELLFATVKERMEHPKVSKEVMYAIDAFMKDDIDDDKIGPESFSDSDIPF